MGTPVVTRLALMPSGRQRDRRGETRWSDAGAAAGTALAHRKAQRKAQRAMRRRTGRHRLPGAGGTDAL